MLKRSLLIAVTCSVVATRWAGPATAAEKASERVSHFTGAFSHVVPVEVPSFRGLEPKLALVYSSAARNGFVGVGWSLTGFSTIERLNKGGGTPSFSADDTYAIDGQLMVACAAGLTSPSCLAGGSHTTEDETYSRFAYDAAANTWTVWNAAGWRTMYSPVLQTASGTLRWGQSAAIDTKGNTVNYTWACPVGQDCYPATAAYNGYEVVFHREARPDPLSFGAADSIRSAPDRLKTVLVRHGSTPIRAYALSYATSGVTGRSVLSSIQQYGRDVSLSGVGTVTGGTSLPATQFTYQHDLNGHAFLIATPVTPATTSEPVAWTDREKSASSGSGNSLTKTAGSTGWTAGAISSRSIVSGTGYVEVTHGSGRYVFGLSHGNTDVTETDVDFGLEATGAGVYTMESGTRVGPWPLTPGDKLRVQVANGQVTYLRNTAVLRVSALTATYPLLVDASIHAVGVTVNDAFIGGSLQDSGRWCKGYTTASGDFNGDGRADEMCFMPDVASGLTQVRIYGPNGFSAPSAWLSGVNLGNFTLSDMDADGKTDLVQYRNWTGEFLVTLSTGIAFAGAPVLWGTATLGGGVGNCRVDPVIYGTGDFNGDGRQDIYCRKQGTDDVLVGLSSGTALTFTKFADFACTADAASELNGIMDFNGDGSDDYYCIAGNGALKVARSTGSAFAWANGEGLSNSFCDSSQYRFGDLNGDGKTDALCHSGGSTKNGNIALSTGRGFVLVGNWGQPCQLWNVANDVGEGFLMDVDGDGASEVVCNKVGIPADDIQVRKWRNGALQPAETWLGGFCSSGIRPGDFNADAKPDLYCDTGGVAHAGSVGVYTDSVIRVTSPLGGFVDVTYQTSSQFPSDNNPPPRPVVTAVTTSDGRGTSNATTYSYSGARMDYLARRFLGFREIVQAHPCIDDETTCPETRTWLRQDVPAAGRVAKIEQYASGELKLKREFDYWTEGSIPRQAALSAALSTVYEAGNYRRTYTTYAKPDTYGNVDETQSHGDFDVSGDELTSVVDYHQNLTAFITRLPARTTTYAGLGKAGTKLAETRISYDNAQTWNTAPFQGFATRTEAWLDPGNRYVESTTEYDAWGNVTAATDPTGRRTSVTYDASQHLFPEVVTNAASEVQSTSTWDPVCSLVTQVLDGNNLPTVTQYDDLCRPTRSDGPLGSFVQTSYLDLGNPSLQRILVETPPANGTQNVQAAEYMDGLGRVYRKKRTGADGQLSIVQETTYNARGLAASESLPRTSGETVFVTTYRYDGLGRRTKVVLPDLEEVTTEYALGSVTVTDSNGRQSRTLLDVQGRKTADHRWKGGDLVETKYSYDRLGRLTGLEDDEGNDWTWTFDTLGRTTSKGDPDSGTMSFTYDDAGRPLSQTDAKLQVIQLTYDTAGRMKDKITPEETTTLAYGEARTGFFNAGQLTSVSTPGRTMEHDYDALGRNVKRTRRLFSVDYVMQYSFDAAGLLRSQTFPDGDLLTGFVYDPAGRLTSVAGYVTSATYDAMDRPISARWGNGVQSNWSYSPQRGFPTSISASYGGSSILDLAYAFDDAGVVEGVTSTGVDETWNYAYDDLGQLTTATNVDNPSKSQSWTVDALGRITENSSLGTYSYPSPGMARPHAPTDIAGAGMTYDDNGNLMVGRGRTITWNSQNKPATINTWQFTYDGLGTRVRKTDGSSTTLYPLDDYLIEGAKITKYIRVPVLGLIAKKTGADRFWLHADMSGSVLRITDGQVPPQVVSSRSYAPYGGRLSAAGSHVDPTGYIGEAEDEALGLSYLNARYYDGAVGVFLSADPIGVEGGLNEYGYANNDPISLADPSGLGPEPYYPYYPGACVSATFGECIGGSWWDWLNRSGGSTPGTGISAPLPMPGGGPPGTGVPQRIPGQNRPPIPSPKPPSTPSNPETPPATGEPDGALTAQQAERREWRCQTFGCQGDQDLSQFAKDVIAGVDEFKLQGGLFQLFGATASIGALKGATTIATAGWWLQGPMWYPNAHGVGINLMYGGAVPGTTLTLFGDRALRWGGMDWHRFKLGAEMVNRPHLHYHRWPKKAHWPWK